MHIININLHNSKTLWFQYCNFVNVRIDLFYVHAKFQNFLSLRGRDLGGGGGLEASPCSEHGHTNQNL